MPHAWNWKAVAIVALVLTAAAAAGGSGCGGDGSVSGGEPLDGGDVNVPSSCFPAHSHEPIPQRHSATAEEALDTFANLAGEIEIQCGNCHKAPAQQGGFSYTGTPDNLCYARGVDGKTPVDVMLSGEMPYKIGGQQALGRRLQAWIEQGCPSGTYKLPKGDAPVNPGGDIVTSREVGDALTDLGNCIPKQEIVGQDPGTDGRFLAMKSFADLPAKLSETDVVSLDGEALARRGTIAYAPTYPLWSDDARKLRLVHVPAGQAITYDPETKHFRIPSNTRFYKTFFKAVVEADGVTRYRKMETRIIVTREHQEDTIFGSYVWNAEETGAKLLGTGLDPASPDKKEVYLNGQPFPDYVRPYKTDERATDTDAGPSSLRSYAVPGATRCVACHTGSEGQNFVLGFTPIQINRRAKDEGGVYTEDVLPDELSQLERLSAFGVVKGVSATDIVKLEDSALPRTPRNADELNMQAYMAGNCAHCHNPNGYAVASSPALRKLNMAPGGSIFRFEMATPGSDGVPYFRAQLGDFDYATVGGGLVASGIYRRVVLPTGAFNLDAFGFELPPHYELTAFFNLHMPLHTGGVDCRLPVLVARWWASLPRDANGLETSATDAKTMERVALALSSAERRAITDCKPPSDLNWVLEDTTERDPYVPRNIDWRTKMDDWIRAEDVTSDHEALGKKVYYQGYFQPNCIFPDNDPAPEHPEPWMFNEGTGQPLAPWSQLYKVTPGEHVFAGVCSNCHGFRGDAQTGAARALRATSGARVASFVDGLFGPRTSPNKNLATFSDPDGGLGENGAAKYLVWMANGGTNISFGRTPEEERDFFNAFVTNRVVSAVPIPLDQQSAIDEFTNSKANMLQVARAACDEIRTDAHGYVASYDSIVASENWTKLNAQTKLFGVPMWRDVCTLGNPLTPELRTGALDSPDVQTWLKEAIFNVGVMVYIYIRDELTKGVVAVPRDACVLKYPAK